MFITSLKYHRNGVAGTGYYAARLRYKADGRQYDALAIVFDADGHIAVTADHGEIGFRYEDFAKELRTFIDSPAGQRMAFPLLAKSMTGAVS